MRRYQYQVCQTQQNRITFVNGEWQGKLAPGPEVPQATALDSCPRVWTFLNQAGEDGWELITTAALRPNEALNQLYLKRPIHLLL